LHAFQEDELVEGKHAEYQALQRRIGDVQPKSILFGGAYILKESTHSSGAKNSELPGANGGAKGRKSAHSEHLFGRLQQLLSGSTPEQP
jgi:hypothetical protein